MASYLYSDVMYIKGFQTTLAEETDCLERRNALMRVLDLKTSSIMNRANGLWKMPEQRVRFLREIGYIRNLLEYDMSFQSIAAWISRRFHSEFASPPRIKILFLVEEAFVWASLESFCMAAKRDPRFEVSIVYTPFAHDNEAREDKNLEYYKSLEINVADYSAYDLCADAPDVAVFVKPYDSNVPASFTSKEVERIVDRLIYVPYGMELNRNLIRYSFGLYLHYRAWRHIGYGPIVMRIGAQAGYRNGENIAIWGHPKADQYLNIKCHEIPKEWKKKIQGRRVLLWCPHHTIMPGKEKVSTWSEFSETVFSEMQKHPEIVLLWRPHPMMFGAIVNNGLMTQEEMDAFIREKQAQDNIILDTTADYLMAVELSDGMISDGTTFSIEYLYTEKMYLITSMDISKFIYAQEDMEDALYIADTKEKIVEFIDRFAKGEDPKREKRLAFKKRELYLPEHGTVGENIINHIYDELTQEEMSQIKRDWSDQCEIYRNRVEL